jgi:hypothetical protein
MVVARKTFIVNSEQARQQAERRFKRDERLRDGRSADTKLKQFAKRPIVDRTIAEAQHGELYSGAADGDLRPMQYVLAFENSMTPGSISAGRSCGSTTVATIMSQRSLKATDRADLPGRSRAVSE